LLEQVCHAKGACLVGNDGHNLRAQRRVFQQPAQHAHKGHGGAHFLAIGCQRKAGISWQGGHRNFVGCRVTLGQIAPQRGTFGVHVLHLGAVSLWLVEVDTPGLLVS